MAAAKVYGAAALLEGPRILIADGLAVLGVEVRAADRQPRNGRAGAGSQEGGPGQHDSLVAPRVHVVQSGDWLSKLGQRYYGDIYKWPVIFEANRRVIGHDPNLIKPGQKLVVPELPKVTAKRR
jgi:nucleoid-associated protein YgaU